MSSIKHVATKLFATLALATALVIACAGSAFAATISVQAPTTDNTTITATVDTSTLAMSTTPIYGQYYKSGAWNYLASNYYVSFDNMMQAALNVYNSEHSTAYTLSDLSWTTMTLSTTDMNPYTKYYPSYTDITSCRYIFENGLEPNDAGVISYTYENACAGFAFKWGTGASTSAALSACNASSVQDNPRLVMGISNNMDTSTAMGKRYPSAITAIVLSR